jgi:hypothetical protein
MGCGTSAPTWSSRRSHARTHAFEIAIAAVVAATDRGINDQEMERLLTDYDITSFDVTRAKAWLDPLAEAVE